MFFVKQFMCSCKYQAQLAEYIFQVLRLYYFTIEKSLPLATY